jgi:amino acid transporter
MVDVWSHDEQWSRRERGESELQRLDRNLVELVSELRVMQTGVQVLFAFLLAVPFAARFPSVTTFEKIAYLVTLLTAATASALLMAPAALHRILFRRRDKKYLIQTAHRLALAGMCCVAVAMTTAVLMVVSVLFGNLVGSLTAALGAAVYAVSWFVLPLRRRHRVRLVNEDNGSRPLEQPGTAC